LVALVTGANKGIGKEIARQLADAGLTVYVGSRDAARGERAVGEIGGDTRLLVLDVTDDASIADVARQVGTLDILVNNAGISGDGKTPDQQDSSTFRRIYETNVFGVVAVTNAFLPALRRSAHPRIVNVSSGTGSLTWATDPQSRHWPGRYAAYRSSKTALNALTVFYAHNLADDGIKVNALAPGLRRTDLNATAAASGGDPAEAAAGAVRLALLPDDGPTGEFFSWDGNSSRYGETATASAPVPSWRHRAGVDRRPHRARTRQMPVPRHSEGPAGGTRAGAGEGSYASCRPCFRRSAGTPAAHRSRPGS
jgi:NAD(P)-dependent dehydrogenase (short-subunit alcohol dehydrogenase family)